MAKENYEESLRRLLVSEGGYTNHPSDPGGPTNFGITIHDYRKYVKPDATAADVKAMSLGQAKTIYRAKYWDAQRCDELPSGVDYAIFDYGVNSGIGRSGKVLRRMIGLTDNTSVVTPGVIEVVRKQNAPNLISAICAERLRFLQSLKTWPVFGKGWGRRVAEVKLAALAMSSRQKPIEPTSAPGKGVVPESNAPTNGAGAVVVAGAGAAQAVGWDPVKTGLIVIGVVIAAIVVWLLLKSRHDKKQEAAH